MNSLKVRQGLSKWAFWFMLIGFSFSTAGWCEEQKPKANRLANSASPYLLQHAHNPVDWYPWGKEAFDRAAKENKPIFLSVGYAACHWCHVMERESFSDAAIAKLLNENFVCVKVDREERPDVDAVYMAALQAFSGGGGWPMNMMLLPDGRPFFGMTYMPPRDKDGDEGFESLLKRVKNAWRDHRAELEHDAGNLATTARRIAAAESGLFRRAPIRKDLVKFTVDELSGQFDPNYGGFGASSRRPKAPKFPEPGIMLFFIDLLEKPEKLKELGVDEKKVREMLSTTLDNIARGGIRDHLAGGIHRYSTDRYWTVPHFEKMLYDNALWLSVTSHAFSLTGEERWKNEVNETVEFLKTTMWQKAGGFDSSLDADTDGVEGATYVWTKPELESLIRDLPDADLFQWVYGLKLPPNYENRDHILAIPERWTSLTNEAKLSVDQIQTKLRPIREKLAKHRAKRAQPAKDDKCLTSWNGLAIGGLADAGRLAGNASALEMARKAAGFILDNHLSSQGLRHVSRGNVISTDGPFLEDYAYLVHGLLKLHEATQEPRWLEQSVLLSRQMIELFEDTKNGGFFDTKADSGDLFVRPRNWFDSAMPSAAAVATMNLMKLHLLTKNQEFFSSAQKSLEAASGYMNSSPDTVLGFVHVVSRINNTDNANQAAQAPALAASDDRKAKMNEPTKKAKPQPVRAILLDNSPQTIAPGEELKVSIRLVIDKGYHTYANPSLSDTSKPTELTIDEALSAPVTLKSVQYPEGKLKQLSSSGLEPVAIYEDEQTLKAVLVVPADAKNQEIRAALSVNYQVCTDQYCLPPARIRVEVPLSIKQK